jgi:hypothetical protein
MKDNPAHHRKINATKPTQKQIKKAQIPEAHLPALQSTKPFYLVPPKCHPFYKDTHDKKGKF